MLLTPRQTEVINLVADGKTCKEVALDWGVNHQTVKNHMYEAMYKLNATTYAHAVRLAIEQGYINIGRLQ